jgi:peptidoglycan/xylan/chitin deacetylase (PgdA/CDA1 family)
MLKSTILKTAFSLGLDMPLRWIRRRSAVVLMYHGFTDRPSDGVVNYQGNRLQASTFRRQLAFLREQCNIVTLRDVVSSLTGGPSLPDYAVALTIDDGYESVYTLGFPALRDAKVPATLFVATQFVDERVPLWPDRLEYAFAGAPGGAAPRRERLRGLQRQAKDMLPAEREALIAPVEAELGRKLVLDASAPENYRPVTWAQTRDMAASGLLEIGSHTHTHTIMTLCDAAEGHRELALSKNLVEKNIGRRCDLFCYPNGDYDDFSSDTTRLLKDNGFLCGLSTVAGFVKPGDDPYTMLRFGTDDRDSFESFQMTFSLGRNLLQGVRHRASK